MATLKHINSKNADYGAAEQYLLFEHDEFTMKPVLDETGRLIPREDYRLSTLNCDGEDFAVACMRANLRYQKNQRREDVKSHHYIISFDPRDGPDNGLTVDRAQALGEQFCKEHFPGHQALVCTHPDGHNHSGNIHVHIVINSLRIEEVPFLPYMDRPADTKVGCKHRCTDAALRYFKSEVMEMCHREGLYQIDLLNGSKNRVTDREYWAQKKGQAALDKQNAPMIADSITPRQTKFETNKEKLRQTLRKALATAASFDEFSSLLLQEGVTVKESRGRLSYLTPDRTKPITARKLGDDFDRAAVFAVLEQNAARAAEAPARSPDPPRTIKDRLQVARAEIAAPKQDGVQRLVDIEQKMAEGKGRGYERWAKIDTIVEDYKTVPGWDNPYIQNHVVQLLQGALAVQDVELAYELPDAYFHIQTCDDGFDYTLYNKDFTERDGGILETDGDKPVQEAMTELLAEFGCNAEEGRVMDAAELREQADTVAEQQAEALKEKLAAEKPTPEATISFYVAECAEFPVMGEFHDNLTLEQALEVYDKIPAERMNGIKSIGFSLEDGSIYSGMFDLMVGGEVQADVVNHIQHYRESPLVQKAISDIKTLLEKRQASKELEERSNTRQSVREALKNRKKAQEQQSNQEQAKPKKAKKKGEMEL